MFYEPFFMVGYCFSQKSLLEACLSQEARRKRVGRGRASEGRRGSPTHGETPRAPGGARALCFARV